MTTTNFKSDLFHGTAHAKKRKPRRVLAKIYDIGDAQCCAEEDLGKPLAVMLCRQCGWRSDWLIFDSASEAKRGIPCPVCNGGAK